MKTIFRSIIDLPKADKPSVDPKYLLANYEVFGASLLEPEDPSYIKLYHMIEAHYRDYHQMPGILHLVTMAERDGEEGVLAALKDIVAERPYTGSDYKAEINLKLTAQKKDKLQDIIQKSWEIANNGIDIGVGSKKTHVQGITQAIDYFVDCTTPLRLSGPATEQVGIVEPDMAKLEVQEFQEGILYVPHNEMGKTYCYRPSELIIMASRTGGGKSTRLLFEAMHFSLQGKNGLYFTLEMPAEDVYRSYFLAMHNNTAPKSQQLSEMRHINSEFTPTERDLFKAIPDRQPQDLGTFRVAYIPNLSANIVRSTALTFDAKMSKTKGQKIDYIMVDYAGLMRPDNLQINKAGQTELLNQVIRELKLLALIMRIPVFTAFQLNRESLRQTINAKKNDKPPRPQLYHLAWANEVERSADTVIFLHQVHDDMVHREYEIIVGKCRKGPTGKIYRTVLDLDHKTWADSGYVTHYDSDEDLTK